MKFSVHILTASIVFFTLFGTDLFSGCSSKKKVDDVINDENHRNIVVVNQTKQVINEAFIEVGEGMQIENSFVKNPDEKSFSIEISDDYSKYSEFKVVLVDNYKVVYEKVLSDVPEKGLTEAVVTEKDQVDKSEDWWTTIEKFINSTK
jgi:hypothetical protein